MCGGKGDSDISDNIRCGYSEMLSALTLGHQGGKAAVTQGPVPGVSAIAFPILNSDATPRVLNINKTNTQYLDSTTGYLYSTERFLITSPRAFAEIKTTKCHSAHYLC